MRNEIREKRGSKIAKSPNKRVAGGGVVESRGGRVKSFAAAVNNKRISFGGESLSGVLVDRRLNAKSAEQHRRGGGEGQNGDHAPHC